MQSVFAKLKMRIKETHNKNAYFEYNGIVYLKTRISHGKGDIPSSVVERIRKQFLLNQGQFSDLI